MKIKLTRNLGGNKAGATINVTPKTAEYLTAQGHVDDTKPEPKQAKKTDDTKPEKQGATR